MAFIKKDIEAKNYMDYFLSVTLNLRFISTESIG